MTEPVFYKSPLVLTKDLQNFWPLPEQSFSERVNSVVRLIIYACAMMYIYNRKPVYLTYGVVSVTILALVYASTTGANNSESFVGAVDTRACTRPTADNPFMNRLPFDDPTRPPACDPFDPAIQAETRKYFNQDLWRNASDVWQRENSQREYYTVPCTTAIPDTKKFAEFCFGGGGRRLRA